ncbi:hypothetical protein AB0B42_29800, partial [Streptomyces fradiae]
MAPDRPLPPARREDPPGRGPEPYDWSKSWYEEGPAPHQGAPHQGAPHQGAPGGHRPGGAEPGPERPASRRDRPGEPPPAGQDLLHHAAPPERRPAVGTPPAPC